MENDQIRFEQVNVNDGQVLLGLMKDFYAIDDYPFNYERNLGIFKILIDHPEWGRIWVCRLNNDVVAYFVVTFGFSFEYGGRDAIIDELYICKAWRNKGLGARIINFIEEESRNLGINTLHLEVEDTNKIGCRLYENQGFTGKNRKFLSKVIVNL